MNQSKNQKTKNKKSRLFKKEVDNWKDKYLRLLADYQNLQKRVDNQIKKFQKKANKDLLLKFLEVLDLIEQAEIFIKDQGLQMIKKKFLKIMKEEGVEELKILGQPYDPHWAECIEVVKGERDNIVVEVIRKGYKLNEEVIRAAWVKVEKKKLPVFNK